MKRIFVLFLSAASLCSLSEVEAQRIGGHQIEVRVENQIEQKGSKKSNKKRERAAQKEVAFQSALALVNARDFVLEANKLSMPDGSSVAVFSDVNYLMMNGDKAVIQVNPGISGGPNGMGGITLEGRVVDLSQETDKRGNVILRYTVMSTGGSAEVELMLLSGDERANATVTPKMHSTRVIMFGKMLATENSRVFKGFSM